MEQAKRRIRICLICVVTAAVILGILYYVMSQHQTVSEENGTLVSVSMEEGGNDGNIRADFIYQREKNKEVKRMEVLLGDILSMECTDQAIINRLKTVRLFRASQKKRYVVSILKVISKIHEIYPNLTVENMGETDLIISVEEQKKKGKVVPLLKSVFVVLVTFIGAGFSIMTFNNDVDVPKLFDQIYFLVTGNQSDGFGILELTYCIGMSAGILLFFNHFGKKRFTVDPTPMEVEMRTYEEEIEMTLIDEYSRKKEEKDVG